MKKFSEFICESFNCFKFKEKSNLKINQETLNKLSESTINVNLSVLNCNELDLLLMCLDSFLKSLNNFKYTRNSSLKKKAISEVLLLIKLVQKVKLIKC